MTNLVQSTAGNVLPIVAAGLVALLALIGGGIDIGRAYIAQSRLQAACDSAVMAGRKSVKSGTYNDAAKAVASNYFATNFVAASEGTSTPTFTSQLQTGGITVTGTASATLSTAIMKIFGINTLNLSVACSATESNIKAYTDIMMVLDTSVSPSLPSRLSDLGAAMKSFYTKMDGYAQANSARIRYGFVPFSSSVNVGNLLMQTNPSYMATTHTIQSRAWVNFPTPGPTATPFNDFITLPKGPKVTGTTGYPTRAACNATQPADVDWYTTGPSTKPPYIWGVLRYSDIVTYQVTIAKTQIPQQSISYTCPQGSDGKYYPTSQVSYREARYSETDIRAPVIITKITDPYEWMVLHPVPYDVSAYLNGSTVAALSGVSSKGGPAYVYSTWAGCIEERQTVATNSFSFTSGQGISPAAALDLNIDAAPTSDPATKWKPLWPEVAHMRSDASNPPAACPRSAQLLTEMTQVDFDAYAGSLTGAGPAYYDLGLIWGARMSSPQGIFGANVNDMPTNAQKVTRHVIFVVGNAPAPAMNIYSAYGIETYDQRITGTTGSTELASRHRSRYLAVCEAIKDKGIRLWIVAYGTPLTSDLTTCASANSTFAAANTTSLGAAFDSIAATLDSLEK
ncbi:MAG: pilus assembly protein TadG-related protein [Novosphingobium sp.]